MVVNLYHFSGCKLGTFLSVIQRAIFVKTRKPELSALFSIKHTVTFRGLPDRLSVVIISTIPPCYFLAPVTYIKEAKRTKNNYAGQAKYPDLISFL